mgnify:CR=1 FL=1
MVTRAALDNFGASRLSASFAAEPKAAEPDANFTVREVDLVAGAGIGDGSAVGFGVGAGVGDGVGDGVGVITGVGSGVDGGEVVVTGAGAGAGICLKLAISVWSAVTAAKV